MTVQVEPCRSNYFQYSCQIFLTDPQPAGHYSVYMQSLYEALLSALTEETTFEARMEIYIGLRKLGWSHRRAEAAVGIRECRLRERHRQKSTGKDSLNN